MKTTTTISQALDLMDKIERLTDETGVTVELKFQHIPLSEMEILAKQENLTIKPTEGETYNYCLLKRGENNFYFWNKK